MEIKQIDALVRQVSWDSVIEIECPNCETTILAEPDRLDLYCQDCKMIVMQNPLIESGFI